MRKVLMLVLASILLSSVAAAQPDTGYLAFFNDLSRTTNCISDENIPPPPGNVATLYVFCLPSINGQRGATFRIVFPAEVAPITTVLNPDISLALGDVVTGISLAINSCKRDWNWVIQVPMWVTGTDRLTLSFAEHSTSFELGFPNCETGFPLEDVILLNEMYLNVAADDPSCVFGTAELSWGAIKNIYKD